MILTRVPGGSTEQTRDFSGNLASDSEWGWGMRYDGTTAQVRAAEARHWYAGDDQLRVVQRYDDFWDGSTYRRTGVWEEYRYDPLGRIMIPHAHGRRAVRRGPVDLHRQHHALRVGGRLDPVGTARAGERRGQPGGRPPAPATHTAG